MKKIIFDVGHPAQVHNFKHVYWELNKKGWKGLFTAKDKEVTISLLKKYDLPYVIIGKLSKNIFSKFFKLLTIIIKFLKVLTNFKPDIIVCRFSPHATWCSRLLGIPIIGLADTEHTRFLDFFTVPLANAKLTGKSYEKDLGKDHLRFDGNIELFYLHPNRYKIPEKKIPELNLLPDQNYALLRFVSWSAYHDISESGISIEDKINLVRLLEKRYKVFISSEGKLPTELIKYKINISPERMHDVLAHATLYIGEGASMASEAACLGVPSFYVNTLNVGYVNEEERFGLVKKSIRSDEIFQALQESMLNSNLKKRTFENREEFLSEKIDPTAFLVWFIENWPESLRIMKEDPGYQERFK